jgi:UDP-N-acetylmuramate: L-alanyl-gamma-D-glutamyl-meso-diaminopimelate ligase
MGVSPEVGRAVLPAFRGVKRRLEVRGTVGGVTVYDDFAHHPSAVRETLKAVRSLTPPGTGRIVAVFEPRSYTSRTRTFEADFARSFASADLVIVAAAHLPGKVPEGQRLSEADLVASIRREGTLADVVPGVAEIVNRLERDLREGDRVVVLSNGGFGQIHERLLQALGRGSPALGRTDRAVV